MVYLKNVEEFILISTVLCYSNALQCHMGTYYKDLRTDELIGNSILIPCSNTPTDVCVRTEVRAEGHFILYDYTCQDYIEPLEDLEPYHNIEDGCFDAMSSSEALTVYKDIMNKPTSVRHMYKDNIAEYEIRLKLCPCNKEDGCNFTHSNTKSFWDFLLS